MNVTMKDIAQELGISIGTVSKVLRDHPDISEETRERVRKRMRELNYRPNLTARALVTGRTHTIGLVVPDLVHPFFGEVAGGLSKLLRTKGYSLIIDPAPGCSGVQRTVLTSKTSKSTLFIDRTGAPA
jgi:LacI family transcriptional regulator